MRNINISKGYKIYKQIGDSAGAELYIKDNNNKTALDYAIENNFDEIKKILSEGKIK